VRPKLILSGLVTLVLAGGWVLAAEAPAGLQMGPATVAPHWTKNTSYPTSIPEGAAVASVTVALTRDDPEVLARETRELTRERVAAQPGGRNAGCVFKNPKDVAAGRIIDELGLKGARRGHAVVSPRHANFVVNEGGATAADVLALVDLVHEQVRREAGIDLELEVKVWGRKP